MLEGEELGLAAKLILFGEGSLHRAPTEFCEHYHTERNHQSKGNKILFPMTNKALPAGTSLSCRHRGRLLKYYARAA
jgi:hypothetical protein